MLSWSPSFLPTIYSFTFILYLSLFPLWHTSLSPSLSAILAPAHPIFYSFYPYFTSPLILGHRRSPDLSLLSLDLLLGKTSCYRSPSSSSLVFPLLFFYSFNPSSLSLIPFRYTASPSRTPSFSLYLSLSLFVFSCNLAFSLLIFPHCQSLFSLAQ